MDSVFNVLGGGEWFGVFIWQDTRDPPPDERTFIIHDKMVFFDGLNVVFRAILSAKTKIKKKSKSYLVLATRSLLKEKLSKTILRICVFFIKTQHFLKAIYL